MTKRHPLFQVVAAGVILGSLALNPAFAASWQGSYQVDDQCYCTGELPSDLSGQIVPTPVGGKTVAQVCERIGKGPKLKQTAGVFNFAVYPDAQCGHGPFSEQSVNPIDCLGSYEPGSDDCEGQGPSWNLAAAFDESKKPIESVASTASAVTGGSRYITPQRLSDSAADEKIVAGSNAASSNSGASNKIDANASVVTMAKTLANRKKSLKKKAHKPVMQVKKESLESLRARQLVQIEAARQRLYEGKALETLPLAKTFPDDSLTTAVNTENEMSSTEATEDSVTKGTDAAQINPDSNPVANSEMKPMAALDETKAVIAEKDPVKAATESVVASKTSSASTTSTSLSALRLPALTRASSSEFDYFEVLPTAFDFGGTGINVAVSRSAFGRMRVLLDASAADSYQEALIGVGFYHTPAFADRLTLAMTAGVEYGSFTFSRPGVSTDLDDGGAFLGLSTRLVVNNHFELQGGAGYSEFFDGDIMGFGTALIHLSNQFDFITKAQVGDNDMFAFGIRYYY